MGKVVSVEEAAQISTELHAQGKQLVMTNGCFDLLHTGHVRLFQHCKGQGDVLFVALNSDSSIQLYKGPLRPICDERERAELVAALGAVDYVVIFRGRGPTDVLEAVKPNLWIRGEPGNREQYEKEASVVTKHGGRALITGSLSGDEAPRSTTATINRICERFGGQ